LIVKNTPRTQTRKAITNYRENKKAILTPYEGLFEMKRLRGIQYTNQYCNLKDETSQATELVM
jgi:hypothetical protein